jgi:hypothetical protein
MGNPSEQFEQNHVSPLSENVIPPIDRLKTILPEKLKVSEKFTFLQTKESL